MARWTSALLAAVTTAALGLAPAAPAAAAGPLRIEAETAKLGPTCGDNQAQHAYEKATGESVVFLGGRYCYVTMTIPATTTFTNLRWHAGGANGGMCGFFGAVQYGVEKGRTSRTCSAGGATDDFQLAEFLSGATVVPGPVQLYWVPDESWYDAHLDWVQFDGDATAVEAESGSFEGTCGDNQAQYAHQTATGETVVFNGGEGCRIGFTASGPTWVLSVRWYGGGRTEPICGTFALMSGATELARTYRTCSEGGATPDDFAVASFSGYHLASGTAYQLLWQPEVSFHDAHVDVLETTAAAPGAPGFTASHDRIDYGLRGSGSPSPVTDVVVTSTNPAPLMVSAAFTSSDRFDVMSNTCTGQIWQGRTCTVGVRFMPSGAGDFAGSMTIRTNAGDHVVTLTGSSENKLPWSFFTTPHNANLVRTIDTVRGTSHDERAGVDTLRMYYRDVANRLTTMDVTPTCDASGLNCTWSVPLPGLPGLYQANARARDAVGHWENPGPTIVIKVV